jgi:hypothetical protein
MVLLFPPPMEPVALIKLKHTKPIIDIIQPWYYRINAGIETRSYASEGFISPILRDVLFISIDLRFYTRNITVTYSSETIPYVVPFY